MKTINRAAGIGDRVAARDWAAITGDLDAYGNALTARPLLAPAECRAVTTLYDDGERFVRPSTWPARPDAA
ncbi:hypothetical protein OG292_00340 [Streptomyces sp. NBC_01511]|uniref:hypothetical protein n=1 Tax=unclassified Streptomyces TaxID=2593676 RepID=UPI00386B27D3